MKFEIAAGRMDGDEINYKFCASTDSADKALEMYESCIGYPIIEFELIDKDRGVCIDLLNPPSMSALAEDVRQTWMIVFHESTASIETPLTWFLTEIEQRVAELEAQVRECARLKADNERLKKARG